MTAPMPPLRILFVITDLEVGGAERMLLKLVSRMAPSNELAVVSLTGRGSMATEFESAGAAVTALGMTGALSLPAAVARLARRLRAWRPQLVSTWMYHADLVGGLAARIAGPRAVAWNIRNSDLSSAHTSRATRAVVRANALLSGTLPRKILCCSDTARRIHVELGYRDDRFQLIPNGFDLQQFRPSAEARASVRRELGLREDDVLIGLVARWHPHKDQPGFIRAAAALGQRHPDAHFVLVGDRCDDGNPELARLVQEAGLAGRVHLLGLRSDIPRLTAALDIATSASIGEAFSNTLGEAMACAVPCVTTDVGDSAYIVGDTGAVVPPRDPLALAQAWAGLLDMPDAQRRETGERARERVSREFEIGAVTRRYETAFRELIHGPHAGMDRNTTSCAE